MAIPPEGPDLPDELDNPKAKASADSGEDEQHKEPQVGAKRSEGYVQELPPDEEVDADAEPPKPNITAVSAVAEVNKEEEKERKEAADREAEEREKATKEKDEIIALSAKKDKPKPTVTVGENQQFPKLIAGEKDPKNIEAIGSTK